MAYIYQIYVKFVWLKNMFSEFCIGIYICLFHFRILIIVNANINNEII